MRSIASTSSGERKAGLSRLLDFSTSLTFASPSPRTLLLLTIYHFSFPNNNISLEFRHHVDDRLVLGHAGQPWFGKQTRQTAVPRSRQRRKDYPPSHAQERPRSHPPAYPPPHIRRIVRWQLPFHHLRSRRSPAGASFVEGLLPRSQRSRLPRRRQRPRAIRRIKSRARCSPQYGGSLQDSLPHSWQQNRPPERRLRRSVATRARPVSDDRKGQGAA